MHIFTKQSAVLEEATPRPVYVVESAGRTCYQSEARGDPNEFIRMLIRKGHESVLEHVSATVRCVTDRGVSHEMVRHRIASYSQESTRYCKYADGIAVIVPPFVKFGPNITPEGRYEFLMEDVATAAWVGSVKRAEIAYMQMLDNGVPPQLARSVLPTCLKTEIVMTANTRQWRHFLRLRFQGTAGAPHPQMKDLAEKILVVLRGWCPVFFEEFSL